MDNNSLVDILLVEDNLNDIELIIRALQKRNLANNLSVISDGEEALDFLFCKGKYSHRSLGNLPRLLLLDIKLPKIGGLEILKSLKSNPETDVMPVVILTSSNEEADISEAYRLGANSYVVKPLDFDQFIRTISRVGMYWIQINKTF
jgi:two-component system, response regulator